VAPLAIVVVLLALLLAWQTLRANTLAAQVGALGDALTGARQEIAAHEQRLEGARAYVDDLALRLDDLRKLLAPK
jgi:hypothetical protein